MLATVIAGLHACRLIVFGDWLHSAWLTRRSLSHSQHRPEPAMKVATIKTNKGDIRIELFDDKTPKTVANFEKLAEEGLLRRPEVPPRDRQTS